MTTLGKILAIVNLVLSLVVGAFLVMSYVARTNWHAAYVRTSQQLDVAKADATAYKDEVTAAQKIIADLQNNLTARDELVKKTKVDADARVKSVQSQLEREKTNGNITVEQAASLTAELDRRQNEVNLLKTLAAQRDTQLTQRDLQVQSFRDRATEMEIFAKAMEERNQRMLGQLESLTKALKKAEQPAAVSREGLAARNPPTDNVEATITKIDPESGLMTINAGSDAGLRKDNTLEVFRLKPNPKYLGTIVILAAHPNEAVGRLTSRIREPVQAGDKVASNVMSKQYSTETGNMSPR